MTKQINNLLQAHSQSNIKISEAIRNSFKSKYWVPFSAAVLCSSYAYALSLSDIKVNSNLGEPFDATVFLTGIGNAKIASNCFSVGQQNGVDSFPGIKDATANVSKVANSYAIRIRSSNPIKEPIAALTLASQCGALPKIERTYTVMIDPASVREQRSTQNIYQPRNNTRAVTTLGFSTDQANSQQLNRSFFSTTNRDPITQNSTYIVQAGDSLSAIAMRVNAAPNRSMWSVAASIYANNPQAFINRDPNFIELGSSITIPSFDSGFVPNEEAALSSLLQNSNSKSSVTPIYSATLTQPRLNVEKPANYAPVSTIVQALPTMTLSTQLSALSLERIEARTNGQTISPTLLPNTSVLFGNNNPEDKQGVASKAAAISVKEATEPKIVYVDRPAFPNEVEEKITAGIAEGLAISKKNSDKMLTNLLAALIGLGLLSWKFIIPYIKRRNRIAFIRSVRAHSQRNKHKELSRQRRKALNRLPVNQASLVTEIEDLSESIAKRQSESDLGKTPFELEQHAADIEAAFAPVSQSPSDKSSISLNPSSKDDSQAVVNKNNGPRKSNVAEKVYEVGTIDDTGELASLTMAFPELEAELNARLGGDIGQDIISKQEAKTSADETLTVQYERPFDNTMDFELPKASDNDYVIEDDFESIVGNRDDDDKFSSTMVFNEEIFSKPTSINPFDENSLESPTLSTEAIGSEDDTRVSELMIDEDGLTAADFGLSDEDFAVNNEQQPSVNLAPNTSIEFVRPDGSVEIEALKLSPEELEAIGLGEEENTDDDNIIPFSKKSSLSNKS